MGALADPSRSRATPRTLVLVAVVASTFVVVVLAQRARVSGSAQPSLVPRAQTSQPALRRIAVAAEHALAANEVQAEVPAPSLSAAPEALTPSSELDGYLVPLVASGRNATLDKRAAEQAVALRKLAHKRNVRVEEPECYARGCSITLVAPDEAMAEAVAEDYVDSAEFRGWIGAKFKSGV